jgi:pimeloyl-ACP methyl ester carboxylesterase
VLPETRYARRGDIHVAYEVLGEGEIDLVFVSEWFFHLEGRPEIPSLQRFLRRLSSFSRLISFDKYGIGLSDPAPPGSLPPLEEWMDDVRAVVDAAGSERAAILGAGEGGIMAAMFAATYPDRTSSLILGNSAARLSWASNYPIGMPAEEQEMLIRLVEQTWGTAEFAASNNPRIQISSRKWRGTCAWQRARRRRRPSSGCCSSWTSARSFRASGCRRSSCTVETSPTG